MSSIFGFVCLLDPVILWTVLVFLGKVKAVPTHRPSWSGLLPRETEVPVRSSGREGKGGRRGEGREEDSGYLHN